MKPPPHITVHPHTAQLIAALTRIRRRVRLWLALDGLTRLTVAASVAFLVLSLLDWWLVLPSWLRAALVLALAIAGIVAFDRRVVRPFVQPIALGEIAARLSASGRDDADRLVSVVDRWESRGDGASELWLRVERETLDAAAHRLQTIPLTARQPLRHALAAAAVLAGLFVVINQDRAWTATAWARIVWPLGATAWPTRVQIVPLTYSAIVGVGDPFTTQMRLARGDFPNLRTFVLVREFGRAPQRLMMRRDPDGVHRRTIDSVTRDLEYFFLADDDDTARHPFRIHALPRPAVERIAAFVSPPAYAGQQPPVHQAIDDGHLTVLQGSRVRIDLTVTQPVARDTQGRWLARLLPDNAQERWMEPVNALGRRFMTELVADADIRFELSLTDQHGLAARPGRPYQIDVRPDEPPTVAILEPNSGVEATPDADIRIRVSAEDDVGLQSVRLRTSVDRPPTSSEIELLRTPRPADAAWLPHAAIEHHLTPSTVGARPGSVIEYAAIAEDVYESDSRRHPAAVSPTLRIQVVSQDQFADKLRAELAALHQQIRALLSDQELLADLTTSTLPRDRAPGHASAEAAGSLSSRQRGLATRTRDLGRQFAAIVDRADLNRIRADIVVAARAVSPQLAHVAGGPMAASAVALARAAEARASAAVTEQLHEALSRQSEAAAALRRLLGGAARWNDLQGVIRKLRELLDRQEQLTRRSSSLGRNTAGRSLESLTPEQQADLRQAARDQGLLHADAQQALSSLADVSAAMARRDPASASAVDRVRAVADSAGLLDLLDQAARRLAENRVNHSVNLQQQAEAAFRAMIDALQQVPDRHLEELSKQLTDLSRRLQRLEEAQQRLIDDNRAARNRPDTAQRSLQQADRQSSLESTTRSATRRADAELPRADALRRRLLDAASDMAAAASRLAEAQAAAAESHQLSALHAIQDARRILDQAADETNNALGERSLAAIRDELVHIRDAQKRVLDETRARLQATTTAPSSRRQRMQLRTLAGRQQQVRTRLDAVRTRLQSAIVFLHVCNRLLELMEQSAALLGGNRPADAVTAQERIVRDLARLIDALRIEAQNRNQPKFVERDAGAGGGGDRPMPDRPIPPLAELRVLRAMQAETNDETARLSEKRADRESDEAAARALAEIAVRQQELHELAVQMVSEAAGPGIKP